ncbi:MAG: ribose 5-phosphate isomerase B [Chloroflexi bacterium RBG_13_53_26]|nr:MAG: ribose 5-phosphate isomerase B [Chloroflexi bacterium RBG_13_53_26]
MHIALGCDHRGLSLKRLIVDILNKRGDTYHDFGSHDIAAVDYPDIARKVAEAVAGGQYALGILVCSSGIGMSIAANKVKGIRAALCHDMFTARRARQHNDANILCLGEDVLGPGLATEVVQTFLDTGFEEGRHSRRLDMVRDMEAD